jgi:hypothetical protein
MSTTGTGTAIPVASLTSWSLDMSTDKIDVTSFGDTTKTYVQGLPDITGRFEGNWDDTEATLFTARTSADGCKLYLYPSLDAATRYAYGVAWLDASINVDVTGAVKVSGSFSAASSWGINLGA